MTEKTDSYTIHIELTGVFALTLASVVGFAFGVLFGVLA